MALTSSLPCIDTLAFQLSRHGLDENRNIKPPFFYSWSEPYNLDFAGKAPNNPKRSRSHPSALVAKRKEAIHSQACLPGLKREKESEKNSEETCGSVKPLAEIHSTSLHTSPGHLTLSVNKYANQANRHEESDTADFAESSDDEISELLVNGSTTNKELPHVLCKNKTPHPVSRKTNRTTRDSGPLKRTLEGSENTNENKRRRPRLDFEKMQLSRDALIPLNGSDKSILDEVYFRPILALNLNE